MDNPNVQFAKRDIDRLYKRPQIGNWKSELELDKLVLLGKVHPNDRTEVLNYITEVELRLGIQKSQGGLMMAGSIL
jgi:hypothetical protein